jgi:hypothetical protein
MAEQSSAKERASVRYLHKPLLVRPRLFHGINWRISIRKATTRRMWISF